MPDGQRLLIEIWRVTRPAIVEEVRTRDGIEKMLENINALRQKREASDAVADQEA